MSNSQRPERRSPRLKEYDYSQQGTYFITICTQNRVHLFGNVFQGEMQMNSFGEIIQKVWNGLSSHYQNIELGDFVVMPNHVHGIIYLVDEPIVGEGFKPSPTSQPPSHKHGLTEIVRGFKTFSARHINRLRKATGTAVWQRSFHDHIVRNEKEEALLERI